VTPEIIVGLVFTIIALGLLWGASRLQRRGLVLIVSLCIFLFCAPAFAGEPTRVSRGFAGLLKLIGLAGIILGIMDLTGKRIGSEKGLVDCPHCGRKLSPTTKICPRCESRLDSEDHDPVA